MSRQDNSITISGGSFTGNAIGIGDVRHQGTTVGTEPELQRLRSLLAGHAEEIVASGRDDEGRAELRHELRKIDQELASGEPDAAAVTTRWKSVRALLEGAAAAATSVSTITELVGHVFGP